MDDCSTDGTRDQLQALQRELGFTLLLQPANGGKGAALRTGFAKVTGEIVVIQDADLEYSPEEYPSLIELICTGRADVVYGSRFLGRHRVFLFTHYVGNRVLTLLTNILYNTMLTDMETCFKVMRAEVLRSMTLESNRFGIEPELTAKIFKRGYRVYEMPITYDGRGYERRQEDHLARRRRGHLDASQVPIHRVTEHPLRRLFAYARPYRGALVRGRARDDPVCGRHGRPGDHHPADHRQDAAEQGKPRPSWPGGSSGSTCSRASARTCRRT